MQLPPPQPPAIVYIYRLHEPIGVFLKPSVFRDDVEIARMRNGRFFEMELSPGTHRFRSTMPDNEFSLNLKGGKTYYLRVELKDHPKGQRGVVSKGVGKVTVVLNEQGLQEASTLEAAARGDLKPSCGCDVTFPK